MRRVGLEPRGSLSKNNRCSGCFCLQVLGNILARQGSKDEFCKKFGIESYNYCLEHGFIHEPFACEAGSIFWEVTRFAQIFQSEIDKSITKGLL